MKPATQALELFQCRPSTGDRIDWLANQLLLLAAESGHLSLRLARTDPDDTLTLQCSDAAEVATSDDPGPVRLFRTLLARFAKMAEEENGTAFNPYGGTLEFRREAIAGPVRLVVEFVNTGGDQSITLVKGPTPRDVADQERRAPSEVRI